MLYLISGPIGNLFDFSFRAVEVLKSCDLILCEDTRRSSVLLQKYEIKKKTESYHQFNERKKTVEVIELLKQGQTIALLSDGGSPGICDPGLILTSACIDEKIPFTAIPGPSAVIQALMLSGLFPVPFQFFGFVPKKPSDLFALLPSILSFPGTSVLYESPQRLQETLESVAGISPGVRVVIAREMTKLFEEVIRSTASEAAEIFRKSPPKGEIVLLIEGNGPIFVGRKPEELVRELQTVYKLSLSEAVKTTSRLLELPKQSVYRLFHEEK